MSKTKLRPVYLADEIYSDAINKSEELFGNANFSGYVRMLIKKDLGGFVTIGNNPITIGRVAERQALTRSIEKWMEAKGVKDSAGTKCMQIVNKIMEETK